MKDESERQRARFGNSFDEMVERSPTGCLEWIGTKDKDGYGSRGSRYGQRRSHRYAYEKAYGPIPTGMLVRHKCDNPACCEPTHLVLGSQAENVSDKVERNRQAKGSRGGRAKLTDEMVLEIRAAYAAGMKQQQIAALFPVTQSSVSLIVLRKQWAHI